MGTRADAAVGDTTIAKWRDGKQAAVGLAFDDSLWSQVDYVIPLLAKNGLVGSFWVNPATDRYGYGVETWEGRAQDLGMELFCHTMNHTGASSYEEADYEIGECARILRGLRPQGRGGIMLFLRGGATDWKITDAQMAELLKKYSLTRGRGDGVNHGGDDKTGDELAGYVREAQADGKFHCIAFHGVGPRAEWLGTTPEAFERLVDYLVKVKDTVWNGTCGEVHGYERERQSAKVTVRDASEKAIRLDLVCNEDPARYDVALTLDTAVPDGWKRCLVRQGEAESVIQVRNGVVRYCAVPGRGEIVLSATTRSVSKPGKPRAKNGPEARKPFMPGKGILSIDRVPERQSVTRELPAGLRDVGVGFFFRLSKDFDLPEYAKGGGNVLTILALADNDGRQTVVGNIYRQGREVSLYVLVQDNKDWHGIPCWPEVSGAHLVLKPGKEHSVVLRDRAGFRDGGAELWLDGILRCSFLRRDTTGRAVRTVTAGEIGKPAGMKGQLRVGKVKASGE